jgi:hypothetical protein
MDLLLDSSNYPAPPHRPHDVIMSDVGGEDGGGRAIFSFVANTGVAKSKQVVRRDATQKNVCELECFLRCRKYNGARKPP